jgi:peptidoglycan/LPS O-acetylase OafA/YrhL
MLVNCESSRDPQSNRSGWIVLRIEPDATLTASRPAPLETATVVQGDRVDGLDLLRLVAVGGIVWFHLHAPGYRIAYSGLPVLLVISIALSMARAARQPFSVFASRRAGRLLVPWLFWSAVYGAVLVAQAFWHREPLSSLFQLPMLIMGTSLHLWYLPFAFLASLAAALAWHALAGLSPRAVAAIGALSGGCLLLAASSSLAIPPPLGQWVFGSAAISFGLAIGSIGCGVASERSTQRGDLLAIAAAVVVFALIAGRLGPSDQALPYGIGVPLVCAALLWKPRLPRSVLALTPLAMGIYVLHPLVSSQFLGRIPSHYPTSSATRAVLVAIASALLTLALRQSSFLRRFL